MNSRADPIDWIRWKDYDHELRYLSIPNAILLINRCQQTQSAKLKTAEFVTLLVIICYWTNAGGRFFPSTREIALRANISQRQVFRALISLEKKKYIQRIKYFLPNRISYYEVAPTIDRIASIEKKAVADKVKY